MPRRKTGALFKKRRPKRRNPNAYKKKPTKANISYAIRDKIRMKNADGTGSWSKMWRNVLHPA